MQAKINFTGMLFCVIATIVLTSCASGLNSYKRGDYYQATIEAVERLRSDPSNQKAQFALVNGYPMAEQSALREINNAMQRRDTKKYSTMLDNYGRLNAMADAIYRCPKALELIPNPTEYHKEYNQMLNLVADMEYTKGIKALNTGTVEGGRAAYGYFTQVNKLVPGFKDVVVTTKMR